MAAALDQHYDGIIVGAGHHGLVLGSYLQKCGLNILLVDRRLQYGGALVTEEATAPGFYHNLHSINHFHISETPWFKDLNLADRVEYITPRYEFGQPHLDGSALIFGRDLEETLANVARFSKKDAQTFRDWNQKAEEITARIFLPERFSDPLPQAEREALLSRSDIGRDFLAMTRRQPFDVVKELFENEHVQLLFLFKISLFGTWLVDTLSKTSPMGSVIRAFDLQSGYQLCKGGSGNLARALFETFIAAGGRYAPQVELDKIVIEGGQATGITLKDGRTVRARQFVASTLNVGQTFEDAIGREQLPAAFLKKLDNFQYTKWTHLRPAPRAARAGALPRGEIRSEHPPHAEMAPRRRDDGGTARRARGRDGEPRAGDRAVRLGAAQRDRSDPGAARQAHDLCLARHAVRARPSAARTTRPSRQEFAERIIEKWAKYAPNMTRKNIIAQHVYTAQEYTQTFPEMRNGDIFMGVVRRRSGDVQPLRLPHAGRPALHGGLGLPSGRRDLRRRGLHQRRHHRARSWTEAVVEAVGRRRGAGLVGTGGGLVARDASTSRRMRSRHASLQGQGQLA